MRNREGETEGRDWEKERKKEERKKGREWMFGVCWEGREEGEKEEG